MTRPQSRTSSSWYGPYPTSSPQAAPLIVIKFAKSECGPRRVRPRCTNSRAHLVAWGLPSPRLLYRIKRWRRDLQVGRLPVRAFQELEDLTTDSALEASLCVLRGLALGRAARDVGLGRRVQPHPDQRDGVQCSIQLPVTAAVDPVPVGQSGGRRDRCDTRKGGERASGTEASGMRPADQDLCGCDGPDSRQSKPSRPATFSGRARQVRRGNLGLRASA